MTTTTYSGKPVASLTDTVLLIAEKDCAAQIAALRTAGPTYAAMLARVQAIADAVAAEKAGRGM